MTTQNDLSRTGSTRTILGVVLILLLLVISAAGFFYWRQGMDGVDSDEVAAGTVAEGALSSADPEADAMPAPSASEAVQEAAEAVERVTVQQGGLEERLEAAERRVQLLDQQARAAAGNAARAEGLLIAFATRRAIERGAELGYLADQLRLRFGDGWPNAVSTIISMSRDPVTLDQLIFRLEGLEPELRNASEEPSLDRLRRELSELFIVRRESSPSPQPMRRMERARLFLESGRYESAIEEVQNMPGAVAAERWIADTRRYAATQRAIDLIETGALLEPRRLRDGSGITVDQPSPILQTSE
ncbi:MAG: hypothetical protein HKO05_11255 [Erythrobacter sp.]|nr:hypothetical protein [Erythrobacter sp.]RZV34834.1 MAG: hypothetical protein EX262_03615 [Sphingomonadaceae bacterium]